MVRNNAIMGASLAIGGDVAVASVKNKGSEPERRNF
ncbi:Hypothetical protein OINT_1002297 [Brucella intermedia LMG 3301]|uniref:Uncharacterized protein n=1 Tax=Brucella intermedia LMG 3301 TaxID=641118 RepID=C4WJS0_9HYPH|nr:Hypothetical protein OINT_1002297 [Brucella intermedia LMG 3301]